MIFHILLVNLASPLFAVNASVKTSPMGAAPPLANFVHSSPNMNLPAHYPEFLTQVTQPSGFVHPLVNNVKDITDYCLHPEIISRLLNTLKKLPHGSVKVQEALINYYNLLKKAQSNLSIDGLNEINSLVQKITNDNSVKVKLSLEYDLSTLQKSKCDQICNALEEYERSLNSLTASTDERNKVNNIMNLLNSYRPVNNEIQMDNPLPVKKPDNYFPFSEFLQQNPVIAQSPNSNPLNQFSPLLQNPLENNYNPLQNIPNVIQNPFKHLKPLKYFAPTIPNVNLNSYPVQDSSPFQQIPYYPVQNLEPLLSNGRPNPYVYPNYHPLQHLLPIVKNLKETDNSVQLQNLLDHLQSNRGNVAPNPLQNLESYPQNPRDVQNFYPSPYIPSPTEIPNNNPLQNLLPVLQNYQGTDNSAPLQNLLNLLHNPRGNVDSNPLKNLLHPTSPTQHLKYNPLHNLLNLLQRPTDTVPNPLQNLAIPQQYPIDAKKTLYNLSQSLKNFTKKSQYQQNSQYHETENLLNYNKDMLANGVDQQYYVPPNPTYSENDLLLKDKIKQLYNNLQEQVNSQQQDISQINRNFAVTYPNNLNTNALLKLNQQKSEKIQMDSSSQSQANSFNYYKQYENINNQLYPQTNSVNGNPLIQQIPDPSKYRTSSSAVNSAMYNELNKSYMKYLNQLNTNTNNINLQYPVSYNNLNIAKPTANSNYNVQLQDLNRLLGVSNLHKLNSLQNKKGIVELTYKLRHYKPVLDPYYYVKYRLPYSTFLYNLKNLHVKVPNLRNSPNQELLFGSDVSDASKDLKNVDRDALLKLVTSYGTLVTAQFIEPNDTNLNEHLKVVQKLNANMPLEDIVKGNANVTKLSGEINPLTNYLRARQNYLNDLQKRTALNKYYANTYAHLLNQYGNFFTNAQPGYNDIVTRYPYNPFSPY